MIRDDLGGPAGAVIILRDITRQVQLNTRLQLAEHAAQTDRLASVGMLAAGVAHEINNPLTYVIGSLDLLQEDLPALKKAADPVVLGELQDMVQEAKDGSLRVARIVSDLKTFARVDDDSLEEVTVETLLDRCVQMTHNQLKHKAKVIREFSGTPKILVNEGRLSQVFVNLLVNAAQAIQEGDVGRNQITLRTVRTARGLVVEIEDSGCGVPDEDVEQLFQAFYTTKDKIQGTGLGLSISQNIVTEMGGKIAYRGGESRGSIFTVYLPNKLLVGLSEE